MAISVYAEYQQYRPRTQLPRRSFNPRRSRRYGRPTFSPDYLIRFSPKWGYSRLHNFPYPGAPFLPRMNTVVIQIHGIAIPNDANDPGACAAAGVCFGPNCSHSINFALPSYMNQTSNRATLEAVRTALTEVISMRHTKLDPRWQEIIIMTNNEYVKQSLSLWIWEWERNGWQNMGKTTTIKNLDAMQEVHNLLTHIETTLNMSVRFWKVDREYISGAETLAKMALETDE